MVFRGGAKTRLATDVLSLYFAQGLNYLVPLLVLPYLLRILGPVGYGAIVFSQSLVVYMRILTDFGFNLSATREISIARDSPVQLAKIFWSTLTAKVCLLVVGVVTLLPSVLLVPFLRAHASVIAVSGLALCGSVLMPQWYFQGLERIRDIAIIQVACNLFMMAGVFLFVHTPADELNAAAILAFPTLLAGGISLVVVRLTHAVRWHRPRVRDVGQTLTSSWHLFVSGAATSLYVNSNVFLIGLICGDYQVALYGLANRIAVAGTAVLSPIVQASFPRASLLFDRSIAEGVAFTRRLSGYIAVISVALSVFLLSFANQIVTALGGARFAGAVPVVRIMGLLPIAIGAAMVFSQLVMVNVGMTRRLSQIYMIAGVLSLVLLPPLAMRFGAAGGAVSLVVVEIVGPVLMAISIRGGLLMSKTMEPA